MGFFKKVARKVKRSVNKISRKAVPILNQVVGIAAPVLAPFTGGLTLVLGQAAQAGLSKIQRNRSQPGGGGQSASPYVAQLRMPDGTLKPLTAREAAVVRKYQAGQMLNRGEINIMKGFGVDPRQKMDPQGNVRVASGGGGFQTERPAARSVVRRVTDSIRKLIDAILGVFDAPFER